MEDISVAALPLLDGLDEVGVKARFLRAAAVLFLTPAGQGHQQCPRMGKRRLRLAAPRYLVAVEFPASQCIAQHHLRS